MRTPIDLPFDAQPTLGNAWVKLLPLRERDFEALYEVASDPFIWEQHPNKDRWQKEEFLTFFDAAIASKGALVIHDAKTSAVIGTSRFYDLDGNRRVVSIGYTFLARSHWGGIYNPQAKSLLLGHAFRWVDRVIFEIGAANLRSQKAIERQGAMKIGEKTIQDAGEEPKMYFIYEVTAK